ncbi:MAG: hypothetical protein IJG97_00760 [Bacilli bacterium]|nr:hypothetical protein [Bacilli bacterium]
MNEKAKKIYKEAFCQFLNKNIDVGSFDEKIERANLCFGPSNDINCNINSKYFSLLNDFNFNKFSDQDLIILENKESVDNEVLEMVERTYKESLKKDNVSGVMYKTSLPKHYVKNGSLVLEFIYGKNIKKLSDEEYMEIYNQQQVFINNIVEEFKKEVSEKIGLNCEIFVSKRVKTNV